MDVYIVFNEWREVMGVYQNKENAEKMEKGLNETSVATDFFIEIHELEK